MIPVLAFGQFPLCRPHEDRTSLRGHAVWLVNRGPIDQCLLLPGNGDTQVNIHPLSTVFPWSRHGRILPRNTGKIQPANIVS